MFAAGHGGWADNAVRLIEADARRSADTHLLRYPLPSAWCDGVDVQLYLKDETTHITGSLKHRLARSLFLYALCNGWIGENTTVIEASSGSTAVSEAYFAATAGSAVHRGDAGVDQRRQDRADRIPGRPLPFRRGVGTGVRRGRAVGRGDRRTLPRPVHQRRAGHRLARQQQHRRVDLRPRCARKPHPVPDWIVVGAGTGGTSATIGRYIRYRRHATRLCVVDPENSAFFPAYARRPQRRRHGSVVTHRGHRPAAGGAVVPARTWWTGWSRCPTRRRSRPPATSARCWAAGSDRRPAPTCGARSACWRRWSPTGAAGRWSRCWPTAVTATPTPTSATNG